MNVASGSEQKQIMAETNGMILSQLTELQQLKTVYILSFFLSYCLWLLLNAQF